MPRRLCLLVTDYYHQSILRFDAGIGTFIDEFVPPKAELSLPQGIAVGPQGDIYASSTFLLGSPPPPKIAGVLRFRGTNGFFVGVVAPHTSPHAVNNLYGPSDLRFGPDGNLYVGTSWGFFFGPGVPEVFPILRYNGATGAFIDIFVPAGSGGLGMPNHFVFGPDGNLYVCNWAEDFHAGPLGGEYTIIEHGGVLRFNGATGAFIDAFIPAENEVYSGIAFGPDGNLYVSSSSSNRILRFNGTTGAFMDVFASKATSPLDSPEGLVFGANGCLYVCSYHGGVVLRYNSATGAYLHAITPPKASLPRYLRYLALVEMDFRWPYFAEWQFVPRYLWVIAIGVILGALTVLSLPRQRRFR